MTDAGLDLSYQISRQKLILVGDVSVGKTSIINSFLGQKFKEDYEPSIGVDFFSKTIQFKGKQIKLQIWDSAGQEKFKSLIPNYIRGASLVFLIYDITNRQSFENLENWISFINNIENTTIVIVGNKLDLVASRAVPAEEGISFAEARNLDFFEVSAKEETNLQRMLFGSLASLPIFEGMEKSETAEILERENSEGLKSEIRDFSSLSIGKEPECGFNPSSSSNDHSMSRNINLIEQNNGVPPEQKKKKKCCF